MSAVDDRHPSRPMVQVASVFISHKPLAPPPSWPIPMSADSSTNDDRNVTAKDHDLVLSEGRALVPARVPPHVREHAAPRTLMSMGSRLDLQEVM